MKLSFMEEAEIISRCMSGDVEAFEMLVKKYQPNIFSMSWNILQDREEARDVTQEAFIQSYLNLYRFDRSRSFKSWLYSIAYRKCLDRIRKKKSQTKFIKKMIKEERLSNEGENKERRIEDSEIFNPLLSKLNKKERAAISLKVNEGYSAREIGQVLNCKESTARVHLFNAKRKLKKFLEKRKDVQIL